MEFHPKGPDAIDKKRLHEIETRSQEKLYYIYLESLKEESGGDEILVMILDNIISSRKEIAHYKWEISKVSPSQKETLFFLEERKKTVVKRNEEHLENLKNRYPNEHQKLSNYEKNQKEKNLTN